MHTKRIYPATHPGETIREDFLKPIGMTPKNLAEKMGVPVRRVNMIVACARPVTADSALRLQRVFGVSARFWMDLQTAYDLWMATQDVAG